MGIRFLCPNGHKLNVKSFLAGRAGICPHCGERFVIPDESSPDVRVASRPKSRKSGDSGSSSALPNVAAVAAASVAEPSRATAGNGAAADLTALDAEGGVWYVRRPSGEQYGPASGDVMRRWINERRVGTDCLVWRDGWPEWRKAGEVFPQQEEEKRTTGSDFDFDPLMLEPAKKRRPEAIVVVDETPQTPFAAAANKSSPTTRVLKTNRNTKLMITLLVVAIAVLLPLLAFVLLRSPG